MDPEVKERVEWWLNDMAYKPPELLAGDRGTWYFYCMAKDIATWEDGTHDFTWSSRRLDPPIPLIENASEKERA